MNVHDAPFNARPRIVILGGGFAGIAVAPPSRGTPASGRSGDRADQPRELLAVHADAARGNVGRARRAARRDADSRRSCAARVSSSPTSTRSTSTRVPCRFRHVLIGSTDAIRYDQVVVALGSSTSTFGLARASPSASSRSRRSKTPDTLRNRLVWLLELADITRRSSEREALAHDRRRRRRLHRRGNGRRDRRALPQRAALLSDDYARRRARRARRRRPDAARPALPPKMGEYSQRVRAQRRGVEVLTGDGVASADDDGLVLQSGRAHRDRDDRVERGRDAVADASRDSELPKTKRGAIVVDRPRLRVRGRRASGRSAIARRFPTARAASIRRRRSTPFAKAPIWPTTSSPSMRGEPTKPFRYTTLGMMASLGGAREPSRSLPGESRADRLSCMVLLAHVLFVAACRARPQAARRVRLDARDALSRAISPNCASIRATRQLERRQPTPACSRAERAGIGRSQAR